MLLCFLIRGSNSDSCCGGHSDLHKIVRFPSRRSVRQMPSDGVATQYLTGR